MAINFLCSQIQSDECGKPERVIFCSNSIARTVSGNEQMEELCERYCKHLLK